MAKPSGVELDEDGALTAFGENLRTIRKAQGMDQHKLHELSGVHFTHISKIERGQRNPSLIVLLRLSAALQIPPELLIPTSVRKLARRVGD